MLRRLASEVAAPLLVRRWGEQLLKIVIDQSVGTAIPVLLQLAIELGTASASLLPTPDHQITIVIELTPGRWTRFAIP